MASLVASFNVLLCARATGLTLQKDFDKAVDDIKIDSGIIEEYKNGPTTITNPISRQIISRLTHIITSIDKKDELIHE